MAGSATGYIDNAVVGSQIRVRVDAEFDFANPDRAEFLYGKCGCYANLNSNNPDYDPNAPGPGPAIAKSVNLQEVRFNAEYAPVQRLSLFVDIPERTIQFTSDDPSSPITNRTGFGDVEAGFKFALLASDSRYLTFQARAYFPTGVAERGLGTGHYSFEPSLLYQQNLFSEKFGDRWTLSSQFGDWHPTNGAAGLPTNSPQSFAGDILIYGLGSGYDVVSTESYRVTPVLEFVGWSVLSGFVTPGGAANTTIVNLKIGVRTTIHDHNSIYIGYGHALTNVTWYENLLRLEYRYVF